ncbi:hypothetical protein OVA29_08725 [Exiguobacterium sp. SL14]|nr:hypothetical protein [Exiguobacterium sp. SL14]MCY1690739.1 hypothetical protein [Exiguobacterium sp. SL14]
MAFEQRVEEINGTKYTFQFPGLRAVNEITDRTKNQHGIVQQTKMQEEFFKHIIVEPKVSFDYFDDKPDDYKAVMEIANEVFQGPLAGK